MKVTHYEITVHAIGMQGAFKSTSEPVVDEHGFLRIKLSDGYQCINKESINEYTVKPVIEDADANKPAEE